MQPTGYKLNPAQLAQHVPPHWMLYIQVENVDASAAKVPPLGGKVILAPFDVMDAGRMSVIQDPTGAYFCLWQPKKDAGIGIGQVHGTLCWADLNTSDPQTAAKFYSDLLDGSSRPERTTNPDICTSRMAIATSEECPPQLLPPGAPPHWLAYFLADDVDATANKAKEMGAKLYLPPTSMEGVGRFSIIADPQGAVFAIFKSAR